jgi:hypothetical protein
MEQKRVAPHSSKERWMSSDLCLTFQPHSAVSDSSHRCATATVSRLRQRGMWHLNFPRRRRRAMPTIWTLSPWYGNCQRDKMHVTLVLSCPSTDAKLIASTGVFFFRPGILMIATPSVCIMCYLLCCLAAKGDDWIVQKCCRLHSVTQSSKFLTKWFVQILQVHWGMYIVLTINSHQAILVKVLLEIFPDIEFVHF